MFSRQFFAERLKTLRIDAGLSGAELSDKLGITASSVTQLEKGQRSPSVELLCSLADTLGVSVDYLIGNEDNFVPTTVALQDKLSQLSPNNKANAELYITFLLSQQAETR